MGKLVLILIIGAIIYFLFFKKTLPKESDKPKKMNDDDMVECSRCGVYVNIKEAVIKDGKYYCSKECAYN